MVFHQKNIISISDFSKDDIEYILDFRENGTNSKVQKTIKCTFWKLLGMLLYQPSTRTRLSFEAAMKRLGGSTIGFAEANVSSTTKGENLTDTVKIVGEYSDAIVIRHNMEGTARFASRVVDVPVINAGDGTGQHPTQTLLDLYTMKRVLGKIDELHVACVGNLNMVEQFIH